MPLVTIPLYNFHTYHRYHTLDSSLLPPCVNVLNSKMLCPQKMPRFPKILLTIIQKKPDRKRYRTVKFSVRQFFWDCRTCLLCLSGKFFSGFHAYFVELPTILFIRSQYSSLKSWEAGWRNRHCIFQPDFSLLAIVLFSYLELLQF